MKITEYLEEVSKLDNSRLKFVDSCEISLEMAEIELTNSVPHNEPLLQNVYAKRATSHHNQENEM